MTTRYQRRDCADIDPAYLDFLRDQPCCVCTRYASRQMTPTEAAHIGDRGLGQKCPDRQAIPLCVLHHRIGPSAHHRLGKRFWSHHSLDREALIAHYNQKFENREEAA